MRPALPVIWLITDRSRTPDLLRAVDSALRGTHGAVGIQLREKDLEGAVLLMLAHELRQITRRHGAPLAVNGRFDIALACDSDAVHLGGDAPCLESVCPFIGDIRVGVSIHNDELPPMEADYAFLAPIFPTSSKLGVTAIGVERLRQIREQSSVPVYALGGVDESNARECRIAGASGVAVLGAVLPSPDPASAMARLLAAWNGS